MKVTNIKPYAAHFISTSKSSHSHPKKWVFIKIETDEGIYGWGEIGTGSSVSENLMSTAVKEVSELFIGENPMDIERLWHKLFRKFSYMGSRGFTTSLIAGFDIALWDIKGKFSNMPIYDLLGGRFRDPVRLYCNSWFDGCDTPEEYAKAAENNLIKKGYSACKLDPFLEMAPYHTMYQAVSYTHLRAHET